MLVAREKPGFQVLSKGHIVLLCAEIVQQGVPDHGAVHSECLADNRPKNLVFSNISFLAILTGDHP